MKLVTARRFDPHPAHQVDRLRGAALASFPRRAAALTIDFAIAGAVFLAGFLIVGRVLARSDVIADDVNLHLNFFGNWYSVLWLVAFLGLSNHLGDGRTIGKRVLGLRAVSLVHEHLRGWPAFERALAYGASTLELGFGFLQYFIHPQRQTVHDRIAETIVIDERAARAPSSRGDQA